jgi:NADH-quinone oxidoreductase subunit K|tara:strand:- start:303 stop:605 length:303 start_codon:yes stop_codon:yes gene_type:complete
MVPLTHYLLISAILFSLGVAGVLLRRNVIMIFMSIELMLNAVNLTFVAFSKFLNNLDGHIFTFMVMTVAAAEAAVGLAIVIALFRKKPTANVDEINLLKL